MRRAVLVAATLLAELSAWAFGGPAAATETLRLCALAPCPALCGEGRPRRGFAVDLMEAALAPARVEVHFLGRARCLRMVADGVVDGAIAAPPDDAVPASALVVALARVPLGRTGVVFLTAAGSPRRKNGGQKAELAARLGAGLARLDAEGRTGAILAPYGLAPSAAGRQAR